MKLAELESRLVRLEQQVSRLADQKPDAPSKDINAWMDEIHGTFKNDAAYREAARLGRKWRDSHHPGSSRTRKPRSK